MVFFLILFVIYVDLKFGMYFKIIVVWGMILVFWVNYFFVIYVKNWEFYEFIFIYIVVSFVVVFIFYRWRFFDRFYFYFVFVYYFDVVLIVVVIYFYGYCEVYWIENYFVNWFGVYIYYLWIILIFVVVYYVLKEFVMDEEERCFWYLVIYIFGFGLVIRDFV